jgi:preprotein translocase subunit YajC
MPSGCKAIRLCHNARFAAADRAAVSSPHVQGHTMNFLISDAWAQAAPAGSTSDPLMSFLPLILIFVVFYFLLIRPQSKRAKEHKKMLEQIETGDEVITTGGLFGVVSDLGDNFILLNVAEGIEVKVQRQAIAATLPKGSAKTL